jgi:hypothetical protein
MKLPILYNIERALQLITQHNLHMGHDPELMAAVARSHLLRDFGPSALESVDQELGKMSDESFHESLLTRSSVPMTHLCGSVLQTMQEAVVRQAGKPPIAVNRKITA